MKYFSLIFALTLALAQGSFIEQFEKFKAEMAGNETNTGNIWVLLVAGSNGYDNYRHQVRLKNNSPKKSGAKCYAPSDNRESQFLNMIYLQKYLLFTLLVTSR